MTDLDPARLHIIEQLEQSIAKLPSSTDHLLLMRWRLLSAAQYLIGYAHTDIATASRSAIETFIARGAGASTDEALSELDKVVAAVEGGPPAVLPFISAQKRRAVKDGLEAVLRGGPEIVEKALQLVPELRRRLALDVRVTSLLPGLVHRFELAAAIVEDPVEEHASRMKVAAGLLYLHQLLDVIPDSAGSIGLMDDDYALRIVLHELGRSTAGWELHWSEKVCSLWYEMPFLMGLNLKRRDKAIASSWLDRLNSYAACTHAFQSKVPLLIMLQPAISCSPVHPLISLLSIVVLDAITSSRNRVHALRAGQTYEVDGKCWVQFCGLSDSLTTPGWLKLRVRDGTIYQAPSLVDRMVPVADRKLSSGQEFSLRTRGTGREPLQKFYNWGTSIGQGLIGTHLVLVGSRERVQKLFDGLQSNGVELLRHGLVRFLESAPTAIETYGTLIFVVPSLNVVRLLLQKGIRIEVIFVDGYDKLERGRHDLPFVLGGMKSPSVICWSTSGYFPMRSPHWLPEHQFVELGGPELREIIHLENNEAGKLALCETFNTSILRLHDSPAPEEERQVGEAIQSYLDLVSSLEFLPEVLKYQLRAGASTLRTLALATPALWQDVGSYASRWFQGVDATWATLRSNVLVELKELRAAQRRVADLVEKLPSGSNSRAIALLKLSKEMDQNGLAAHFVCFDKMQVPLVNSVLQRSPASEICATLLKHMPVSRNCIVAGWSGVAFGRRLWAHAPRSVHALVDEHDHERWTRLAEEQRTTSRPSIIDFANGVVSKSSQVSINVAPTPCKQKTVDEPNCIEVAMTPCVFLWLVGEREAKIIPRDARLFVQHGELIREREAMRLRSNDRVILGAGNGRWSPTDEFTEVLFEAVAASHPELVDVAKEWRRAINKLREASGWTIAELRSAFEGVGVVRELQTLEGWLELSRASPIAPRGARTLQLLAPLIEKYSRFEVVRIHDACSRLKRLRLTSGRALLTAWKGTADLVEIPEEWLGDLLDRLRREVQVYEVESLTLGDVPTFMLGWWLPADMISEFESQAARTPYTLVAP